VVVKLYAEGSTRSVWRVGVGGNYQGRIFASKRDEVTWGKTRKLHNEELHGCKIDRKSYVWAMVERVDLASDGERERLWHEQRRTQSSKRQMKYSLCLFKPHAIRPYGGVEI